MGNIQINHEDPTKASAQKIRINLCKLNKKGALLKMNMRNYAVVTPLHHACTGL